jgi:hypothetical protein
MVQPSSIQNQRPTDVLEGMFGSAKALEQGERELKAMLEQRGIFFGEKILPTFVFAFVSTQGQSDRWARQAELVIEAAEYCAQDLIANTTSCDTVSFTNDVQDLVYAWPGYKRTCVICRPDGIPVGLDINFVELNCDSPAMMMFLDIVAQCLLQLDVFASMRGQIKQMSAADKLLESLLDCYREYGGSSVHPTIAITDWEGQKTRFEHQRLAEHFRARGYDTVICDPRAFRYANRRLTVEGRQVHLIYRRALVAEIIERRTEIEPMLDAYKDGAICMVNPLRSYVASAKSLLTHLVDAELPPELAGAADLIPRTVLLDDPAVRAAVKESSAHWVLKRSEGHGGMHVVLPGLGSSEAWREAWLASAREVWIAQRFLEVPRMSLPFVDGESLGWTEKYFNWNPFVFGGRYGGGLVRVSNTPLINITLGGGLMPSLVKS